MVAEDESVVEIGEDVVVEDGSVVVLEHASLLESRFALEPQL